MLGIFRKNKKLDDKYARGSFPTMPPIDPQFFSILDEAFNDDDVESVHNRHEGIPRMPPGAILSSFVPGMSLKRTWSRKGTANRWLVRYNNGTGYYGATIEEAVAKCLKNNEKLSVKFKEGLDS